MGESNLFKSICILKSVLKVKDSTFWVSFFAACYLASLPMSGTIALRNVSLVALCVGLAWVTLRHRSSVQWPIPIMLWAAYLFLFPFISNDPTIAAHSLMSQWGRGLLAMLAGAGVASLLFKRTQGSAFFLGILSMVPIIIHLCLFALKAWETSSIPWGYWGRESHHADLGYAAGQAVILLAAAFVVGNGTYRGWAAALIAACLLSTALANSRAGFVFALVGGLLVFISVYVARRAHQRRYIFSAMVGLLFSGVVFLSMAVEEDTRWPTMTSDLIAGFLGDAIQIECEGTSSIASKINAQYGSEEEVQRVISSVKNGDAARVVVLRAGIALASKYPWGNDGSRFAYQNLLREQCSQPVILMAHTHNGWIDTILALGWVGGALYLMVFSYFFVTGYTYLRSSTHINEWAIVLVALAVFWILRGLVDSVFKDHMLEMQGFVLAYAAANISLQRLALIQPATKKSD